MKNKGFHTYLVDVSNRKTVFETQRKVKSEIGAIDILINNAGVVAGKSLMDLTEKQIRLTMDVNVTSHF